MSARGPNHQLRPDPLVTAANRLVPVPAEVIHPHVGAHADGFQRRPVRMAGAFRWEEIDAIIVALTAARAV
jgi:ribosomal protein L13E